MIHYIPHVLFILVVLCVLLCVLCEGSHHTQPPTFPFELEIS